MSYKVGTKCWCVYRLSGLSVHLIIGIFKMIISFYVACRVDILAVLGTAGSAIGTLPKFEFARGFPKAV